MSAPTNRNRLDEAASPYLEQHADNPVNWQPWDETARQAAADRDAPIFLSIGYAACHWCHVMAEESFEDDEIAAVLNESFVPIKVDREERPDVDRVYQTICQLVTGSGGWPLSVWLTPDGRPFYVGTYFPKTSGHGRPGFLELLERLRDSWTDDRSAIESRADEWAAAIDDQFTPRGALDDTAPGSDLRSVADAVVRSADPEHGGFGTSGPKFPQPQRIQVLLRMVARGDAEPYREAACGALDAMANGGIYDHVGGGFHRYATDPAWRVPHFEKMLYDNATLPSVYLAAYQLTGDDRYADVACETFEFLDRELRHAEGGFFSSLDAQSEGREGAFYVWRPEQVDAVLDDDTADLWCDAFGITDAGNFEGGTSVPARQRSIAALADRHELDEDTVRTRLSRAREELFDAREERPRPGRDEKILAGWNGLAISALAEGGLVLDPEYAEHATTALVFLRDELWDPDANRLRRRYRDGQVGVPAYLDDYAYLGRGAFDAYQATGEVEWLAFARSLCDAMLEECWDEEAGRLYLTPESGEIPVSRPTDPIDQSLPSSVGVAADLCCSLAPFDLDDQLSDRAADILAAHESERRGTPIQHLTLSLAADRLARGSVEWTVVGETITDAWRQAVGSRFVPGRILARRPAGDLTPWLDTLGLDAAPPIWADRTARDGETTAYICRDFTCSPPITEPDEALAWLDRLGPGSDEPPVDPDPPSTDQP